MDHRMFTPQVAAVTHQYRVLIWDVQGHGLSQSKIEKFSIRAAVEDLLALLDELDYEQAILVGHSMGGYISQELLFLYPERVTALVTIGCTCISLPHPPVIVLGMRLSSPVINLIPYRLFVWLASRHITVTSGVRAYVDEVVGRHSKKEFVRVWSAVMNCVHPEPDYWITQPVLVTHGQYDYLGLGIMAHHAKAWAKRDPNCHHVTIPAAGHNAQQENPPFFNQILLDFLEETLENPPGQNSMNRQTG
jgi:pimeloyl-ACP methyl ester carboxylesterase